MREDSSSARSDAMRVRAGGYRRHCGYWNLHDDGIAVPEVEINWVARDLTLNGSFRFRMFLSRDEIADKFLEAFADADIGTILDHLEKARKRASGQTSSAAA
jgi:hypothetical protein